MSVVFIDQEAVHYEVFGRGRPVLFLHGFLGSWRYWLPSMEIASKSFRTFSFDFIGFGDTGQREVVPSIGAYADQVIRFLDALGIGKVTLVGHSMGGMVSLKTAIEHPERIERVVTVGAPIVGTSLTPLIKIMSNQTVASLAAKTPMVTKFLFRRALGRSSEENTLEILDATIKPSSGSVRASMRSMMHTDLRQDLLRLRVPALAIHGTRDDIVSPSQIKVAQRANLPLLTVLPMERCRHFPWNDDPDPFHEQLLAFLKAPLESLQPSVMPPAPGLAISAPPLVPAAPTPPTTNSAPAPLNGAAPATYLNGAANDTAAYRNGAVNGSGSSNGSGTSILSQMRARLTLSNHDLTMVGGPSADSPATEEPAAPSEPVAPLNGTGAFSSYDLTMVGGPAPALNGSESNEAAAPSSAPDATPSTADDPRLA